MHPHNFGLLIDPSNSSGGNLSMLFGVSAGVYGRLSPAWLLWEEETARNVRRYLGQGDGVNEESLGADR